MRVKNLISHPKTQQSFGNDFKQALPLRLSGNYEVFSISYIEILKEGIKITYFEVIISFSTYKTIITHHKKQKLPP